MHAKDDTNRVEGYRWAEWFLNGLTPKDIHKQINTEFLELLKQHMIDCMEDDKIDENTDFYLLSGAGRGFSIAYEQVCADLHLEDAYKFYNDLDWETADDFATALTTLIDKHKSC
ncbi:MAG: hypothetical protein FWD32_01365 [Firmicutes bacterium]|nr:hypothetical protein [Bacillota bacterium]